MKFKNVLVIYMKPKYKEEKQALAVVLQTLKKYHIHFTLIERSERTEKMCCDRDLIIIVGGDGTFLRGSHFITDAIVFGVNAHPMKKEGFLMQADSSDFAEKFSKLIHDKARIIALARLETTIIHNGVQTKLADSLNEVFVGHRLPYKMSRYTLIIGKKKEYQKSSGIIVGTAIGSHAWLASAGGKKFPIPAKKFQYIVREAYQGRLHQHQLFKGFFGVKDELRIIIESSHLIVVIDSLSEEYPVKQGDILVIKASKKPLRYVYFE